MGKALLLDSATQKGVNSSTFSFATWWRWGPVAGLSVILFCKNEARALCEQGDVLQLHLRAGFDEVETFLLGRNVQGSFQVSTDLCAVAVP